MSTALDPHDAASTPSGDADGQLVALAERVAGWARTGEEVEVYVARGDETEVRAYDGEVESLTSATSAGIGIRVVVDHRLGFAWAGSLDESVLGETLDEARDNAEFATPDEHVRLAVPDGVAAVPGRPVGRRPGLVPDHAQGRAGPGPRGPGPGGRPADPPGRPCRLRRRGGGGGPGVDDGDPVLEPEDLGVPLGGGDRRRGRGQPDRRRVQRRAGASTASTPTRRPTTPSTRAVRLLGATKGPSGRQTVVFDRRMATTLLSVVSSALSGEAVAKGRSFFAGRIGEQVGDPGLTLVDDPTDPRAYGAAAYDAEGLACRRNVLIDAGRAARPSSTTRCPARRAGVASTGSAVRGGFAGTPGPGCRALTLAPGPEGYDEDGRAGRGGGGPVRPVDDRGPLGGQPDQRRLLGRRRGPDDPGREAGRAGAGDHRGLDPAAHAAVAGGRRAPTSSGCPASPPARRWPSATCRSAGSDWSLGRAGARVPDAGR